MKKVGEKRVKNRLPSPIYGLTFKGVMTYLSMQELTELESIGTQGESNEELKKRYIRSRRKRFRELQKLQSLLKTFGKTVNYQIFNQIDWLLDNYGWMIISLIMRLAQKHIANPPNLLEEFKKHQKKEEQHLLKTLEIVKNTPSLQKMTTYFDDGRGKVYKELDVLKDKENRLEQLRKEMDMLGQNENEYFRKSFADDFFVNLTFLRKNKKDGNEALKKMAETLLEEKRSVLSNLESVVEKLGGE